MSENPTHQGYQSDRRQQGVRQNIAMISQYLDPAARTGIDVGCNEGLNALALVDSGLAVIGYEVQASPYNRAMRLLPPKGLQIFNERLSLNDIESIAEVDVLLLLSVHHQVVKGCGLSEGNQFMIELAKKTKKQLFFQPSCISKRYGCEMPFRDNGYSEIVEYFSRLIGFSGSNLNHVQMLGLSVNDLPDNEPFRPMILFSNDSANWQNDSLVVRNDRRFLDRIEILARK